MYALIFVALAAADLPPPPLVDAPPPAPSEVSAPADAPPETSLEAPAPAPQERPPPVMVMPAEEPGQVLQGPQGPPEPDGGAQTSFVVMSALHGGWLGLNACGAVGCLNGLSYPVAFPLSGVLGAGVGMALSFFRRDLARDWGRAALLDSAAVAAPLAGLYVGFRPSLGSIRMESRYTLVLLTDFAITAGAVLLAHHVTLRPDWVWLADSTAIWGAILGGLASWSIMPTNPGGAEDMVAVGATAGALTGGLLAFASPRVGPRQIWVANGLAVLGGTLVGGTLLIVQLWNLVIGNPTSTSAVAIGTGAGIAGGFLLGFAVGREW